MRTSTLIIGALAMVASAAPAAPHFDLKDMQEASAAVETLSDYFNKLAYKTQAAKVAGNVPVCNVAAAQMPVAPVPLPPPSLGLKPYHVAIGRGTQNYTCEDSTASTAPVLAGAVATLFNVSCLASVSPDLVSTVASMSVHFSADDDGKHSLGPAPWIKSGVHYFSAPGVPFFNLNEGDVSGQYGVAPCAKNASSTAPNTATVGQKGEPAVAWLKLNTVEGATHDIKEVYRVDTVGGSAPATCQGMESEFQVEYAAVYWFWAGKIIEPEA